MSHQRKIAIIGLGYVGLPLAVAFGEKNEVIAFDINPKRIAHLKLHQDSTGAVSSQVLSQASIDWTQDAQKLAQADFYIIAVPTPVDTMQKPDLRCLLEASQTVGSFLKKGDIVVYESTVYPGATEEVCVPLLEKYSNLVCGKDFSVGYSPERMNAGDHLHQLCDVVKVISGWDEKTTDILERVYSAVVHAGVYRASSIKVAEAAKVIENTQRDLNIALMNELAIIFAKMEINTQEVIKAASTKWNFMAFQPGLVGGHCIGVDPYYLTYKAQTLGYQPEVILSGRRINDGMGKYIAQQTVKQMILSGTLIKGAKVAILGLTFKENCGDLRNSKVRDVMRELQTYGVELLVHDPVAIDLEVEALYHHKMVSWNALQELSAIVLCIGHRHYCEIPFLEYVEKLSNTGARVIFDVKSILNAATDAECAALKTIRLSRL